MKTFVRVIAPFLIALVMFNCIRLVTDLTLGEPFWGNHIRMHLRALSVVTVLCYCFDWFIHKSLSRNISCVDYSAFKEYALLTVFLFLTLNCTMLIGGWIGLLYMGNGVTDYIIANVICIPIFLLYYTLIRNSIVSDNYHRQSLLFEKVKVEQLGMELKFLKSQYHPHFLFNALNTIYFQIDEENGQARLSVELLSELLRYQLYDIQKKVTLRQEVDYLKAYIRFQQLRMSRRLRLTALYDEKIGEQEIHPLLFQPLVENAFKYVGGTYEIYFAFKLENGAVTFISRNSTQPEGILSPKGHKGIGIENLRRRLDLLYPDKYKLTITPGENSFSTELIIDLKAHDN